MPNHTEAPPVSRQAAFAALRRMLRPAVRLALRAGLKFSDLDALLRELLAETGRAELARHAARPAPTVADSGGPVARDAATLRVNLSALSVLTGLHRKDLARRYAPPDPAAVAPDGPIGMPSDKRSTASQVLLCWADEVVRQPGLASLSVVEFTERARRWVTDVHPRAVLDELLRLGLVRTAGDAGERVDLVADRFVPAASGDDRLLLMADNVRAHLEAGLHNSLPPHPGAPLWLEQSLWGEGMSLEDCQAVAQLARAQWEHAHQALYTAIAAAPELKATAGAQRPHRIQIGMFAHMEPMPMKPVEPQGDGT